MTTACRWRLGALMVVAGLTASVAAPGAAATNKPDKLDPDKVTPVIFVHGGSGSGAQFESQQMRLTSNGFPQRLHHTYSSTTRSPPSTRPSTRSTPASTR